MTQLLLGVFVASIIGVGSALAQNEQLTTKSAASASNLSTDSPFEPWLKRDSIDMKFTNSQGRIYTVSTHPTKKISRFYGFQCTAGDIPTAYSIESDGSLVMVFSPEFPGCDKFKYVFGADAQVGKVYLQPESVTLFGRPAYCLPKS